MRGEQSRRRGLRGWLLPGWLLSRLLLPGWLLSRLLLPGWLLPR
jgi:hypothetical protein